MEAHSLTSQFGWDGDDGLGDRLISAIFEGRKTATCCPRALYSNEELNRVHSTEGQVVTIVDKNGTARGRVRISEVF